MEQKQVNKLSEIRKTVELNASIEKVWNAIATSEGIAQWWMKNTFNPGSTEFKLISDQFGESPCKVTKLDPPKNLAFNWDKDWHIEFILKELSPEKCQFTLIHTGWDANKQTSFGQPHTVIHKVMDDGWANMLQNRLPKILE